MIFEQKSRECNVETLSEIEKQLVITTVVRIYTI